MKKVGKGILILVLAVALAVGVIVAINGPKILNHETSRIDKIIAGSNAEFDSDAVVALAPLDQRLPKAVELMEHFESDTLVISMPEEPLFDKKSLEINFIAGICQKDLVAQEVFCFEPKPETTLGEALAVRDLVAQYGWESIAVVTNDYHAMRTNFIFNTCLPNAKVEVYSFNQGMNPLKWVYRLTYESLAYLKAQLEVKVWCK